MQRVLQEGKHVPTPLVIMNKAGGNQSLAVVYLTQKAPDPHYEEYAATRVVMADLGLVK